MRTIIFKEMSRKTDAAARHAVVELLDAAAADLTFTPGSGLHVSCANEAVTVWLRCLRTEGQRSYYTGVVTAGLPPRAEVVGIPWRLTDHQGRPIGGGVTGTGGHFSFALTLAEDKLSQPLGLRFGEPARLDGPEAEADLRCANSSDATVSPAVASTGHTPRRVPESLASAANDAGAPGRQPMSEDACGYWVDSGRLRFRLPEEGRFPFSAVWIEVHERDCVVASRLLPVQLDPNSNCYRNSLPVTELLGDRPFTSNLQIHYWSDEPWMVEKVTLEEVERVLETSYVRNRPDVKHGLERLRQRIEERRNAESSDP